LFDQKTIREVAAARTPRLVSPALIDLNRLEQK